MELAPFLLDQWLDQATDPRTPIAYHLGSSTGPAWTLRELLALLDDDERERLFDTRLVYTRACGGDALRQALAGMYGVAPDEVQVLTGAAEALLILAFLAAEPGANVVLARPCFPAMENLPRGFGLETRAFHLRPENGFRVDLDEVRSLVDVRTKYVLVNSPHNPTGATLSDEDLDALHAFAAERGVPLICDEVYHPIYHGDETGETRSAARLPHAVVLGDLSKALSLSGLRVGWMVERDPARRAKVLNARQYFSISNAPVEEALATAAIRRRDAVYGRVRAVTQENLALLDGFFAAHGGRLSWVRPRGGMTAFPWLTSGADTRPFCEEVAREGVLLAPGDCFGMPSHLRLGFGSLPPERFAPALARVGARLAGAGK